MSYRKSLATRIVMPIYRDYEPIFARPNLTRDSSRESGSHQFYSETLRNLRYLHGSIRKMHFYNSTLLRGDS